MATFKHKVLRANKHGRYRAVCLAMMAWAVDGLNRPEEMPISSKFVIPAKAGI